MAIEGFVALCAILTLLKVNYLQVDLFSSVESAALVRVITGCGPRLTINPIVCEISHYHLNYSPAIGIHRPLLVANTVKKRYLQYLEEVCYTSVHMWCWLRDLKNITVTELPKICDGFILADQVEIGTEFPMFSSNFVQVFVSRKKFQFCGRHGIGTSDGVFQISANGLNIGYVIQDGEIYNGPLTESKNSKKKHLPGKTQGFERSLMLVLGSHLNITFVNLFSYGNGPYIHFSRPKSVSNILHEDLWDRTTTSYVITKQAIMAYGDLSVIDPRDRYTDFTIVVDVDANSFISRMSYRKLSGVKLLAAGGKILTNLYFVAATIVTALMVTDLRVNSRKCRRSTSFQDVLFYNSMLLFQQSHPSLRLPSRTLQLDCLWRLTVFFIGATFSARIVTFLASVDVDGRVDSFVEIAQLLLRHKEATIFHDVRITQFQQIREKKHVELKELQVMTTNSIGCDISSGQCFENLMGRRLSLVFSEGLILRRGVWERGIQREMHLAHSTLNNCYQAFALSKGCYLKDPFNKVIRRLLEGGVVKHFKNRAGLEDFNAIQMDRKNLIIEMDEVEGLFIILLILLAVCAFVFLIEHVIMYVQKGRRIVSYNDTVPNSVVSRIEGPDLVGALSGKRDSGIKSFRNLTLSRIVVHSTTRLYKVQSRSFL